MIWYAKKLIVGLIRSDGYDTNRLKDNASDAT